MNCPKCKQPMTIAHKDHGVTLYKCRVCGHQTLVENETGRVVQEWKETK